MSKPPKASENEGDMNTVECIILNNNINIYIFYINPLKGRIVNGSLPVGKIGKGSKGENDKYKASTGEENYSLSPPLCLVSP